MSEREDMVEAIRGWFSGLPPDVVRLAEHIDEYEHVLTFAPVNPRASGLVFRVTPYGTFGLHFGLGANFEDIRASTDYIVRVCESVREGRVTEDVWKWRGRIIKTRSVLQLGDESLWDAGSNHWLGFLPVGTRERIQYEPWDRIHHNRNAPPKPGRTDQPDTMRHP